MGWNVNGKNIETDDKGYLLDTTDWSEDVALEIARHEGVQLDPKRWELIEYFRGYYQEYKVHPGMHRILKARELQKGRGFEEAGKYRDELYKLFPAGPVPILCKLAGLPEPVEDAEE